MALAYETHGDGPPLVCLPWFGQDRSTVPDCAVVTGRQEDGIAGYADLVHHPSGRLMLM